MAKVKIIKYVATGWWIFLSLIILISLFILGGNFSSLVTTILKPKAASVNPKITQYFSDAFKADTINTNKWEINRKEGVSIYQTSANNLRFEVSAGSVSGQLRGGSLRFKELFDDKGDFRVTAVLYRPVVTGEGMGISGTRFASKGTDDDEGAVIQWKVEGTDSKVSFVVRAADGTRLESQEQSLASNVAVFRLERINKRYRAAYKLGNDLSADTPWIQLGQERHATLGNEGYVYLFTNNRGKGGKFPRVVGRFDTVNIGWEGEPSTVNRFSDSFSDGNLGTKWTVVKSEGVQVYETPKDNLIMSLSVGAVNNKARYVAVTRAEPVVPEDKDFGFTAAVYKPNVVGEGSGFVGLRFASQGQVDDEAAVIRWVVGSNNVNKLVFIVRAPDGSLAEAASVTPPATAKRLTLRLARQGVSYKAWYRMGDSDADWVKMGEKVTSSNFGANGKVGLVASNMGVSGQYPRVVGRVDGVNGQVAK